MTPPSKAPREPRLRVIRGREAVDGVQFDEAWSHHITAGFADQTVNVISRADLIRNKRRAGRLQDLADVEALERPLE